MDRRTNKSWWNFSLQGHTRVFCQFECLDVPRGRKWQQKASTVGETGDEAGTAAVPLLNFSQQGHMLEPYLAAQSVPGRICTPPHGVADVERVPPVG